ncbi:hypothetical protein SDC9_158998 [bioreactor metagenome]|uniref:Uncharacterized protein n=1 Tax=bioreactor metagenome TaxID=1076179 RepID=A0A645FBL0_9ZZZZ
MPISCINPVINASDTNLYFSFRAIYLDAAPQNIEYSQNNLILKTLVGIFLEIFFNNVLIKISLITFEPNITIAKSTVDIVRVSPYNGEFAARRICAVSPWSCSIRAAIYFAL